MTWTIVLTNSKNKKITAWKKNGIKCKFYRDYCTSFKILHLQFYEWWGEPHFLKINSAILEFKMSRMATVLWKLVET